MSQRLNSGLSQHLSKRLRAQEQRGFLQDRVLYRDEKYFLDLEASLGQSIEVVASQITEPPIRPIINMTAPLEEKGDAGPLVPCQVTTLCPVLVPEIPLGLLTYHLMINGLQSGPGETLVCFCTGS
jgi:hypothetical protein